VRFPRGLPGGLPKHQVRPHEVREVSSRRDIGLNGGCWSPRTDQAIRLSANKHRVSVSAPVYRLCCRLLRLNCTAGRLSVLRAFRDPSLTAAGLLCGGMQVLGGSDMLACTSDVCMGHMAVALRAGQQCWAVLVAVPLTIVLDDVEMQLRHLQTLHLRRAVHRFDERERKHPEPAAGAGGEAQASGGSEQRRGGADAMRMQHTGDASCKRCVARSTLAPHGHRHAHMARSLPRLGPCECKLSIPWVSGRFNGSPRRKPVP
jgi:hypothetical protein